MYYLPFTFHVHVHIKFDLSLNLSNNEQMMTLEMNVRQYACPLNLSSSLQDLAPAYTVSLHSKRSSRVDTLTLMPRR